MASTSEFDFGFAPKKKVNTYGKAGRRRPQATTVGVLRHAESAPMIPTTSTFKSPSSSPEPHQPLVRATNLSKAKSQHQGRIRNPGVRQKLPEEAESQPLPEISRVESQRDDGARAKKRRIVRGYSDKGRFDGPYSTPDSSPSGGRSSGSEIDEEIPRSVSNATRAVASRNTPEKDISMEDAGSASMPFSAKTSRALKNLSVSSKQPDRNKREIPIRLSTQVSSSKSIPKQPPRPLATATSAHTQGSTAQATRKRRLIDTLAAQAEEETSSGEEEASSQASAVSHTRLPSTFRDASPPTLSHLSQPKTIARPVIAAKKTGPKFTYSQQRTMLADDDLLGGAGFDDLGNGSSGGALFNFGRLTKSSTVNTFSYLDEDDETVNTGAVRSLHELRQAGANSRFADEMDDILDRIGLPSTKPSSLRRGALLEVAQKMKHKDFRQQFRNHSDGSSLFKSLGEETDLVSGYAVLAIVTTLLAATTSAHLIQQLRSQGLAKLISWLLGESADIAQLAKDRKHNLSRNGQIALTTIRGSLLDMPIWEPFSPALLPPRTLALKCLDLFTRQSTHTSAEDDVFSQAVSDCLFSILSDGVSDPKCWDFPNRQESCDFYLALYVLEAHSINAMQSRLSSRWTEQYAPTVADVLETALDRPADKFDDLESLTLRISLNITNHNGEASCLFVEKGLLGRLAKSACVAFGLVLNSMKVDSFLSKVLESLIMMLGVMINFCVYYQPASFTLEERDDGAGSPLNQLIRVFADNHSKTADADSMEETQLNVALGYLSILLGYLCLRESIRDRFVSVHPRKRIQPLLDSINEFIAFHHKVAEAQGQEGSKQDSASAALARLQSLVDQLTAQG
ncbi:Wings apart-like protein 1 [Madurella mycetomatis]|uniref:Wings apart-like protein 1 n=1 Tax=Madurella mycetomatis TaxID=100816 RepID=A0A175WE42_9PEZI|nr:Wings apart-like protein 1 [Madurella mycetomatis]